MSNFKELLPAIKVFALDIDGVLTNGLVALTPDGNQIRTMNVRDGYAIVKAIGLGYETIVISGGSSPTVISRLEHLGIRHIHLNVRDKLMVLKKFLKEKNLQPSQVAYMGDDIPDYKAMEYCGVPTCPQDAAIEIKNISKYISDKNGGEGCVRDIIEQVLRCNNHWERVEK